ncbi:MAG TPA: PDZ domain-containing protein [Sphingomonas sp.]|jgi:predicted metalloprotease with PDZ domain|nr:PDZ domain-containing protein [Sphingomonas sp.]
MRAALIAGMMLASGGGVAAAQEKPADPGPAAPVQYDVSFDNAVHHEARITATFRDVPPGPLRVQMARSSPGRYAIHEFAKNVYSVSAADAAGRPLRLSRTDPYGWTIPDHQGTVVVSYTLFGDWGDGTYAQIDATHAHLNMPATFMWASGYDDKPIRVRFRPFDPTWRIATQLPPTREANVFWAPNLQYFMDSPTEISDFALREWPVTIGGRTSTIRLAVHHLGSAADVDAYAARVKTLIAQHYALFGAAPAYDFGTYTFIADYLPQITGDGMEHRNSTIITDKRQLRDADFAQIETLSHEFTHSWNVERLRPAELEPFDFTRANPTPSLWFAEGFTQYYGPLMIRRAGLSSTDGYLEDLSATLNGIVNSPGRRYGSPEEMSLRAPFVDAARAIDPVNPNIFTSYYPYGAVVALALDLSLRDRFKGVTLDSVMRRLWQTHGAPERPYRPADLQQGLADATGDARFAADFFASSIHGSALPDFAPLLARAGLVLRPVEAKRGWIGAARVKMDGASVAIDDAPAPGSPLYAAGVDRGDTLIAVDGQAIPDADAWRAAIARHAPGDTMTLRFRQRGIDREARLRFAADPAIEIVRAEAIGGTVTPAQRAFRQAWLGADIVTKPQM